MKKASNGSALSFSASAAVSGAAASSNTFLEAVKTALKSAET
jgi:uncharacterized protein with FMN-binding domain